MGDEFNKNFNDESRTFVLDGTTEPLNEDEIFQIMLNLVQSLTPRIRK